jgi:hypothetical protein
MASTYSDLKFELIGTGEQAGTWGATTNTNLGTAIEQAIAGKADITFSSTTETLTLTNTNAAQDARAIYLNLGGTPGGAATLEVPAIEKPYIVKNGTGETVTIKVSGQTGVAIPNGKTVFVYNNGTDVVTAVDHIPSLTLGSALPIASGGTGQTTASGAINALIPSQTGNNGKFLSTNGTAVSWEDGGTGDVVGPASASSGQVCLFDGVTGKLIKATSGSVNAEIGNVVVGQAGKFSGLVVGADSLNSGSLSGVVNVVFGNGSGKYTTGTYNTGLGSSVHSVSVTGSYNTGVGFEANYLLTGGSNNTAVGHGTLAGVFNNSNNTAVGVDALGFVGPDNCSALGYQAEVTADNQVQLGNSSTTTFVYGTVQNRSDLRDKAAVRDTQLGLTFITALRPVDYKWDMRDDYKTEKPKRSDFQSVEDYQVAITSWSNNNRIQNLTHNGSKTRTRYHHGLIAQEVKQVIEAQGIDFGGFQDHTINGGDDVLSIGYDELIAPMIKAMQELTARLEAAEAEIAALKG